MIEDYTQWVEDIKCCKCETLMGYAPYGRDEYVCVACYGPPPEFDYEDHETGEEE